MFNKYDKVFSMRENIDMYQILTYDKNYELSDLFYIDTRENLSVAKRRCNKYINEDSEIYIIKIVDKNNKSYIKLRLLNEPSTITKWIN